MAPSLWKRIFPRRYTSSKHGQHNRVSLLKYLFPNAAAGLRTRLDRIRNEHFPGLRHRAQSSIYRYLVNRQLRKQKRKAAGFLSRLRFPKSYRQRLRSSKDALALQRPKTMSYPGSSNYADLSGFRSEGREPGARRKKLAGYLKAANEVRQSYFSGADTHITREGDEGHDSAFPDAAIVRSGNEEMVLFPSYARRHVKSKVSYAQRSCTCSMWSVTDCCARRTLRNNMRATMQTTGDELGIGTRATKPSSMSTFVVGSTPHKKAN